MLLRDLRLALDNASAKYGYPYKQIGWTTRFNAFWNDYSRPEKYTAFATDGEGIDLEVDMVKHGSSIKHIVDWVHIMFYDVRP